MADMNMAQSITMKAVDGQNYQSSLGSFPTERNSPDEIITKLRSDESYVKYRKQTDKREPYRIPNKFLAGCKGIHAVDIPETPLIAFVNSRSGGRAGEEIMGVLSRSIGHTQVFDMTQYRPDIVLKEFWMTLNHYEADDPDARYIRNNLRILVAGGDGSVTWVLGAIADLGLDPPPAVAIMPLGTGNDLSINLGWGGKFEGKWVKQEHIYSTLLQYNNAKEISVDYWNMVATAPNGSYYANLPHCVKKDRDNPGIIHSRFWNYFSVGLDAEAAYGFHSLREKHPSLAKSRLMNQAWYSYFSCSTGWFCGAKPLDRFVSIRVKATSDSPWKDIVIPSSVRALILLNLQTYGGGRDVWGIENEKNLKAKGFQAPVFSDGLMEVVGLKSGWHAAMVMGEINSNSLHAKRLAQCCAIELKLQVPRHRDSKHLYMQLDGEPWEQRVPSQRSDDASEEEYLTVQFSHGGASKMLMNNSPVGSKKVAQIISRAQGNNT